MKMKGMAILILGLFPAVALSQSPALKGESYLSAKSSSLFDPSKLSMRQSYTFGYYSGSAGSGTIGYYVNSLEYAISEPLKLRIDLGFLHNPLSAFSKSSSAVRGNLLIPGFSLEWRPSSSFNFRLDYRRIPYFDRTLSIYDYGSWYREGYR